jgi:hypothetical protein
LSNKLIIGPGVMVRLTQHTTRGVVVRSAASKRGKGRRPEKALLLLPQASSRYWIKLWLGGFSFSARQANSTCLGSIICALKLHHCASKCVLKLHHMCISWGMKRCTCDAHCKKVVFFRRDIHPYSKISDADVMQPWFLLQAGFLH